jgi:hypothetical protein
MSSKINNISRNISNTIKSRNSIKSGKLSSLRKNISSSNNDIYNIVKNYLTTMLDTEDTSEYYKNLGYIALVVISFVLIIYVVYKYYKTLDSLQYGKSYLSKDITTYKPLFKISVDKVNKCIERCRDDSLCDGITYNQNDLSCLGTQDGFIRNDNNEMVSWIKPDNEKYEIKAGLISGLIDKYNRFDKIYKPTTLYNFTFNFYLYINDLYSNNGNWRHIFYKGTELNNNLHTPQWENIIKSIPDQCIGVWLTPFNNNIRIAITTLYEEKNENKKTYKHAMIQTYNTNYNNDNLLTNLENKYNTGNIFVSDTQPNQVKSHNSNNFNTAIQRFKTVEFFDLYNIPIKKLINLSINVNERSIEVYFNNKLHKVFTLKGYPLFNDGMLYAFKNPAIDGKIYNLRYANQNLPLTKIAKYFGDFDKINNQIIN